MSVLRKLLLTPFFLLCLIIISTVAFGHDSSAFKPDKHSCFKISNSYTSVTHPKINIECIRIIRGFIARDLTWVNIAHSSFQNIAIKKSFQFNGIRGYNIINKIFVDFHVVSCFIPRRRLFSYSQTYFNYIYNCCGGPKIRNFNFDFWTKSQRSHPLNNVIVLQSNKEVCSWQRIFSQRSQSSCFSPQLSSGEGKPSVKNRSDAGKPYNRRRQNIVNAVWIICCYLGGAAWGYMSTRKCRQNNN